MYSLILNDMLRVFSRKRTWIFLLFICAGMWAHYYAVSIAMSGGGYALSSGSEVPEFLFRELPALHLMYDLPIGLLFLSVFGIPIVAGNLTAFDKKSSMELLYRMRGKSVWHINSARIVTNLLCSTVCCIIVFGAAYMGAALFSNSNLAQILSPNELNEIVGFYYLPALAERGVLLWWLAIIAIYVLYCWSVLCFSQLLGIITKSEPLSIFLPIAAMLLVSDLFYNMHTGSIITYLDISFPWNTAQKLTETYVQTLQLPLFTLAFISASYISLLISHKKERSH